MVGRDITKNKYKRDRNNLIVRKERSRKFLFKLVFSVLLKLSILVLVFFIAREGWTVINKSETFSIKTIKYSGMNRVSVAELDKILDGVPGSSIFQIELDKYSKELMEHCWIKKVVIYRILPDKLDVRIEERIPGAVAQLTTGVYLVDQDGKIIKKVDDSAYLSLPLLVGLNRGPLSDRDRLESVMETIACLGKEHKEFLSRLSVIDLSNDSTLSLKLRGFDGNIYIDSEDGDRNIVNYLAIEELLKRRYGSVDYVDLRWKGQIYIKQGIPNG